MIEKIFELELFKQSQFKTIDKERVETVRDMKVIIYPNDHLPAHFHVKNNDNSINAKFKISNGEFMSGTISKSKSKQIADFYQSVKGKIILKKIWEKYHG